ncbi:hypothetical protein Pmani_024421 [Petrolisthes manimaculis]|uniref:P-type ATPase A domain-containing protein n=1 Tax=Petrolisthes manimaculis TaxID=1843537 RepID=A0AAE1U027_9EUCA|nr:hypothetical protein Pmani_024421 [Petrolisthes manimaculis]
MSSRCVVPGDVVLVQTEGLVKVGSGGEEVMGRLEMDAVLLEGSVITNEAMLTGEAVPITKVSLPHGSDMLFDTVQHRHHVLQGGTQLLQVRGAAKLPALVINTGFYTARGELVQSILYPRPHHLYLYWDLLYLLAAFLVLGVAAVIWSGFIWRSAGASWKESILYSLDLLTFVVPPIIPATITAITTWAQQRLRRKNIFCLSSHYITPAGTVDLICFDKTGTLTEEDLRLAGVVPVWNGEVGTPQEDLPNMHPEQPLIKALATCHSLTVINGALMGNPLDVKIFTGIDWVLQEPGSSINPDYNLVTPVLVRPQVREGVDPGLHEMATLRSFPFEAQEQRMTVVTQAKVGGIMEVFVKGAPERLAKLCRQETVPGILEAAVEWYTRQGLRVLAVAGRVINEGLSWDLVRGYTREELEIGCGFLGLVVMHNKVKPQTAPALATLHNANLTTVMLTGDNLLTAVCVARESGLVEVGQQVVVVRAVEESATTKAARHLAIHFYDIDTQAGPVSQGQKIPVLSENYVLALEGDTLDLLCGHQDVLLRRRVMHRCRIFARMQPRQKVTVVEALQELGHRVAMCGDGCNDCGALKAADCGISLSASEASVAAPFTSQQQDVTCVPALLCEGRGALVSTFAALKYNIIAGFTSLICVIFLFSVHTEPSDMQYVLMDLGLITIPALVMGGTAPSNQLTQIRPSPRLLSFLPIASILSYLSFQFLTNWMMLFYLRSQPWFDGFVYEGVWPPTPNHENTCIMTLCYFSLAGGALVFSHAAPFRQPVYSNYILTAYLVLAAVFCSFITFYTGDWLVNFVNFLPYPEPAMTGMVFCAAIVSFAVCFVWERWLLHLVVWRWVLPWCQSLCGPRPLYSRLEDDLLADRAWPVLSNPPSEIFDNSISSEQILPNEKEDGDMGEMDTYGEESMLMRKLTRRHQFKATVKYVHEKPQGSSTNEVHLKNTTTVLYEHPQEVGTFGQQSPLPAQDLFAAVTSPPPESAGYREPWDAIQGGGDDDDGGEVFRYNQSVRNQIMKGTSGFRTFRCSVKRQNAIDEKSAQPYEVITLSHPQQENIYSTISENIRLEEEEKAFETEETQQHEAREETEVGRREASKSRAGERGRRMVEQVGGQGNITELRSHNQDISLMDQMNCEWRRISGSPLLPLAASRKVGYDSTTPQQQDPLDQVYDIPKKPPRPVSGSRFPHLATTPPLDSPGPPAPLPPLNPNALSLPQPNFLPPPPPYSLLEHRITLNPPPDSPYTESEDYGEEQWQDESNC